MHKFFLFIIFIMFANACSSVRDMKVLTTRPAYITLDGSIKKLVIVNRTKLHQKSIIENLLGGQIPGNDESLSKECIRSIIQTLNNSNRFTSVIYNKPLIKTTSNNTQAISFLSWPEVQQICSETNTDAVLAIDYFESNYKVINVSGTNPATSNPSGTPVLSATGTATAKATFRIYDLNKKAIAYDNQYQTTHTWTETASTYIEAVAKLANRNDALMKVSYQLGNRFADEIIPNTSWEARLMYKGKEDLTKKAERQALTNNWEAAAQTWEQAYNTSSDLKAKGNIAYNLALSYEVIGDLDKAKSWITKSYIDGGNKKALSYSSIIDGLISDHEVLEK